MLAFYLFPDLSCSNDCDVPRLFAQATRCSRPLQVECVKERSWKTIESPPSPPLTPRVRLIT